jgi:hypothetical protein
MSVLIFVRSFFPLEKHINRNKWCLPFSELRRSSPPPRVVQGGYSRISIDMEALTGYSFFINHYHPDCFVPLNVA